MTLYPEKTRPVGVVEYYFTDETREEHWSPGERRAVRVQLFYPATEASGASSSYVPGAEAMAGNLREFGFETIPLPVTTNAVLDAPPDEGKMRTPIFISHGMNSAGWLHTNLALRLAAKGFVVVVLDHPYWNLGTARSDGTAISIGDGMHGRPSLTSDEIDRLMADGIDTISDDQAFVAERLSDIQTSGEGPGSRVLAALDLGDILLVGHSMGGMASEKSCLRYVRFKACISLDGAVYNPVHVGLEPRPSPKAFMLIYSEQFSPRDETATARVTGAYSARWSAPVILVAPGTRHNSFSDLPAVAGWPYAANAFATQTLLVELIADFQRSRDLQNPPHESLAPPLDWQRLLPRP